MRHTHIAKTIAASLAFAAVCVDSFAVMYEFSDKSASGDFALETIKWGSSRTGFPSNGDQLQVASYARDKGLYLTEDHSVALLNLYFKTGHNIAAQGNGNVLRFDSRGHEFILPSYASGYGSNPPIIWQVYVPAGQAVTSSDYTLIAIDRSSSANTSAVAKFSDIAFRQETDANFATKIYFTRGTCNCFDPEGEIAATAYRFKIGYSSMPLECHFSGGTEIRARQIVMVRAMPIFVDNAKLYSHNDFTVPGGLLVLTNSASLQVAESFRQDGGAVTNFDSAISVSNYAANASACFVQKGGSFSVRNGVTVNGGAINIDGGNLVVTDVVEFANAPGTLRVSGGALEVRGANGIKLGAGGPLVEISGGTLTAGRTRWGEGTSSTAGTIRQTGGVLQNDTTRYMPGFWMNWSGNVPCTLELLGGVTKAKSIYALKSILNGGAQAATFVGNGGTVRALAATPFKRDDTYTSVPLIGNMDSATLGNRGLVVDTANYDSKIVQDFSNVAGESGWMLKTGSSTLGYSGAYSASKAVVAQGTLKLLDATPSFATELVVTNGATFSLVGTPGSVTLDSLVVTNGVLALDPGDMINVSGALSLHGVRIEWSSIPDSAQPVFVVNRALSESERRMIRKIEYSNELDDGKHAAFSFDYDGNTGRTTVTTSVADDEPLADAAVWTGSGSWATAANWENGAKPDATHVATFGVGASGYAVAIADGDLAGALSFTGGAYRLFGSDALMIEGAQGSARIDVSAGAHVVSAPLNAAVSLPVDIASGAELSLDGPVVAGGFAKTGRGRLVLGGTLDLDYGFSSADGIVSVTNASVFNAPTEDKVTLSAGTVEFRHPAGEPMHVAGDFAIAATAATDLVVFKTDTDVTLDALNLTKGAFCKRGVGKLTVNVPANTTYTLAKSGSGTVKSTVSEWIPINVSSIGIVFPEDGTAPDGTGGDYPGFSVAEGEIAFVGEGENAKVDMSYARVMIGIYAKTCAVQPMMTVDNVECNCYNNGAVFLGHSVGMNSIGVKHPVLRILNGGKVYITSAQMGYNSTSASSFITVAATNGLFLANGSEHYLTRMYGNAGAKAYYRFKDSRMYMNGTFVTIGGGIDLDFDNSEFSTSSGDLVALASERDRPWGVLAFRNGSTFAYGGFTENSIAKDLTFAFDDAELLLHKNRASATLAASGSGHVHYEMRGAGAVLKPASGATYAINAKFEGAGGLVVDGEGTVAFGENTAQFSGALDVRQGTADFSANGGAAAFTAVKGAGTVDGATMGAVTLPVTLLGDGTVSNVLTFADCTFAGRVTVDFGRTEEDAFAKPYPSNLLVARYSGTTDPAVANWRMVGSGLKGHRGVFTAANGEIRMTVSPTGMIVIFK